LKEAEVFKEEKSLIIVLTIIFAVIFLLFAAVD